MAELADVSEIASSDSSDSDSGSEFGLDEASTFDHYQIVRLAQNPKDILQWVMDQNLVAKSRICRKCHKGMNLVEQSNAIDDFAWRCRRKNQKVGKMMITCDTYMSVRAHSWFDKSHLSFKEILIITYYFVYNIPITFASRELHISKGTIVDWYNLCREVCFDSIILSGEKIGGEGKTVEIYELEFGKRKHEQGNNEAHWVYSGIERETKKFFMVPVESPDKEKFLPIIRDWILPDSTVISNRWKAYDCLNDDHDFNNLEVSHSLHYQDPEKGACSNRTDAVWGAAKTSMPKNSRKHFTAGYFASYMFKNKAKKEGNVFFLFLKAVCSIYNPNVM